MTYGANDRTKPNEGVTESSGEWSCFQVCNWTTGSEAAAGVQACVLKMVCLGLGLPWGFTGSFLDPEGPTKALLFLHGCQIIVAERRARAGEIFSHVTDLISPDQCFS